MASSSLTPTFTSSSSSCTWAKVLTRDDGALHGSLRVTTSTYQIRADHRGQNLRLPPPPPPIALRPKLERRHRARRDDGRRPHDGLRRRDWQHLSVSLRGAALQALSSLESRKAHLASISCLTRQHPPQACVQHLQRVPQRRPSGVSTSLLADVSSPPPCLTLVTITSHSHCLPLQQTAKEGQEEMNRIIAVLINHCKCHERGTNIVAGIKCVYERKYGIHVGVAKEGAALRLSEVRTGQGTCLHL